MAYELVNAMIIWTLIVVKLTSVAHNKLTKITMARQFCCSGASIIGIRSKTRKTAMTATKT